MYSDVTILDPKNNRTRDRLPHYLHKLQYRERKKKKKGGLKPLLNRECSYTGTRIYLNKRLIVLMVGFFARHAVGSSWIALDY